MNLPVPEPEANLVTVELMKTFNVEYEFLLVQLKKQERGADRFDPSVKI